MNVPPYRGRLAPSPTGFLHLGHARTFWTAQQRARQANGVLILRNEDLDPIRSKPEFVDAFIEDLKWLGLNWSEGPDVGGPFGPYSQSKRLSFYREAFETLRANGVLFPCTCSRKDVSRALGAPHQGEEEPVYPGTCRHKRDAAPKAHWRFRVPDGRQISFEDRRMGIRTHVAGKDFGDFVVWRQDDVPSYQLAVVVDDHAMEITEVVRGEDLLLSTARQLLLYEALGWKPPSFYHCALLKDQQGVRLAKRHDSLSIRALRQQGLSPGELLARMDLDGVKG